MTTKTITIPVMPIGQSRIRYSTPASRKANPVEVSKSLGRITIKVEKIDGLSYRVGTITIPVSKIEHNDCCQDYTDVITWARLPKQFDQDGDVIAIDAYPTLTVDLSQCCQWQAFVVRIIQGDDVPIVFWEFRPDELPVEQDTESRMIPQNLIPPGAQLELSYEYWNYENRWQVPADIAYWCTCCFTGGVIRSISGAPGSQDVTYTVEIMGQERLCRPSDYIAYGVGDWVFVGRLSSECSDHTRLACKKACESDHTDGLMIIPLEIGGFETEGPRHENIEYGLPEVPELFDTCLKAATIIDIDHGLNQADVDVAGLGRLDGIPFFVHPPDSDTVDGGSALFEADNQVTVLYHEDFQYIIGLGLVLYWEGWEGPNIASNHPWDLTFIGDGYSEYKPANAPSYTDNLGSYAKIDNGVLKMLSWADYNNVDLYLRASSDYQIDAPAGVMILAIERARSEGIDGNTTIFLTDTNGKTMAINITITGNKDPDDWGNDVIYNLAEPVPETLSGTYTINLVEAGLTAPIVRTQIAVWSGTEETKLEIDYIDFL